MSIHEYTTRKMSNALQQLLDQLEKSIQNVGRSPSRLIGDKAGFQWGTMKSIKSKMTNDMQL